jgi:hypothetical protein
MAVRDAICDVGSVPHDVPDSPPTGGHSQCDSTALVTSGCVDPGKRTRQRRTS